MRLAKMESLKNYSNDNISRKVNLPKSIFQKIPDDYLSDNLITKRLILERKNKLLNCSSRIYKYGVENYSKTDGELHDARNQILYGNFCNQYLVCPICARRRADIIRAKYLNRIVDESKKYKYKYFITFTIPVQKSFNQGFKKITAYLKRFRLLGQKRKGGGYSGGESAKIKAAIGCGECKTSSRSKLWHIHYHFLALCDEPLDYSIYNESMKKEINRECQRFEHREPTPDDFKKAVRRRVKLEGSETMTPVSKLTFEWYKVTNQTAVNVDVRPVPVNVDIRTVAKEVIKYASKVNELSDEHLLELLIWKDKKKFLTTWGSLRQNGEDEPDVETDEELFKVESFKTHIWDYENREFTKGTHKDNKILLELVNKKDRLKEYTVAINRIRSVKDGLLNIEREKYYTFVCDRINRDRTPIIAYKKKTIRKVNSIRKAYKTYIEKCFRYIVDIKELRNTKIMEKNLNKLDKRYFRIFDNLQYHKINF